MTKSAFKSSTKIGKKQQSSDFVIQRQITFVKRFDKVVTTEQSSGKLHGTLRFSVTKGIFC